MNELLFQPAWLLATVFAVLLLIAWRTGLWIGKRQRLRDRKAAWSRLDDASLMLLGLLIAFAFGMSISRHEDRRIMLTRDANSIGDFYTCASLLKDPVRSKLQRVIRNYAVLHLEAGRRETQPAELNKLLKQFQQLHQQMTELVDEAVREGTPIAVPLTTTLNGLTSAQAERASAVENRLPASIGMLLFVSATVATMLIGRGQGVEDRTDAIATLSFILMVVLAVYVTIDLNQPQRGLTTISQAPMERLLSSMSPSSTPK
jgi:hypothetical protein